MRSVTLICLVPITILCFFSCNQQQEKKSTAEADVKPVEIERDLSLREYVSDMLTQVSANKGKLSDTVSLDAINLLQHIYSQNENGAFWSEGKKWKPFANTFIQFLDTSYYQGLVRSDYNYSSIAYLKNQLDNDSLNKIGPERWAKADLLLTKALMMCLQDIKQGRLLAPKDKWINNPDFYNSFFEKQFARFTQTNSTKVFTELHPDKTEYQQLLHAIKPFSDSMDKHDYTYLEYPYKDSMAFLKKLITRLAESNIKRSDKTPLDSAALSTLISDYQKKKKLKADGKISQSLVRTLNNTALEKYRRIAVTLDKYKGIKDTMPEKYIWVNLPSFTLKLWNKDSVAVESKVIVGAPGTPTPLLSSKITDMVLNPTWTVPSSIIKKEMLPGLKRNPNYLARRGLYLLDGKGRRIDPNGVNWAKYENGIPYRIQQGSGDNNALGVIKFNFPNKYSVYLHDTNARGLFKRSGRSLSHGCVRVQAWEELANFIATNDSINLKIGDTLRYTKDSLKTWLNAGGYRTVVVKNQIPVFFRYYSVEVVDSKLKIYEDIYGSDRALREKYFARK